MDLLQKRLEEEKFLKKKSAEKFKILYEQIEVVEESINDLENNQCCCDCEDDIEKIKKEQLKILQRLSDLEFNVEDLEDRLDKLELKINGRGNPSRNI